MQQRLNDILSAVNVAFSAFFTYVLLAHVTYKLYEYLKRKGVIKE